MLKIKKIKNQTGFSVLEVMVALVIINIGLLGVASLVIQNIQVERVNKNYVIASMLAQEGLELIRNQRDNNWINPSAANWYDNIYNSGDSTFVLDYDDVSPDYTVNNITDARLYIDGNGRYNYAGAAITPFLRLVTSTVSGADNNVDEGENLNIFCLVQWTERGQTHKYEASTQLYDWR